jgi:hypothetical protein
VNVIATCAANETVVQRRTFNLRSLQTYPGAAGRLELGSRLERSAPAGRSCVFDELPGMWTDGCSGLDLRGRPHADKSFSHDVISVLSERRMVLHSCG